MHEQHKRSAAEYPTGRGYGHDVMRGGEVFGGYGYSDRPEYEQRRGDTGEHQQPAQSDTDAPSP